jgi:hypothetical protein
MHCPQFGVPSLSGELLLVKDILCLSVIVGVFERFSVVTDGYQCLAAFFSVCQRLSAFVSVCQRLSVFIGVY